MLPFTYQGKDWHSFTPSVCLTEVWKATADKRMVSKGMWLSQYAPKGVKSLCITSSQTVYVRKPDLVSSKTLERLGGRLICEIYLNTYFQRARLGGRLICELGLYASIYGIFNFKYSSTQSWALTPFCYNFRRQLQLGQHVKQCLQKGCTCCKLKSLRHSRHRRHAPQSEVYDTIDEDQMDRLSDIDLDIMEKQS